MDYLLYAFKSRNIKCTKYMLLSRKMSEFIIISYNFKFIVSDTEHFIKVYLYIDGLFEFTFS